MIPVNLPVWKKAPFLRLIVPFVAGILVQWYCQPAPILWTITLLVSSLCCILFFFLPVKVRFNWGSIGGIAAMIMLLSLGALITWYSAIRNHPLWFGKSYDAGDVLFVKLEEPLLEKPKSWKAAASVEVIVNAKDTRQQIPVKGKLLLYFQKDPTLPQKIGYGTHLLFKNQPQLVSNTGNPGSFDYRRYCLFEEGITHQVYLTTTDMVILPQRKTNGFRRFIFSLQERVLAIIRTNVKKEKEVGLAEALLIGYQEDVDRTLMQSYSNTGVIHVIAISGLHLGLIYWVLDLLLKPLTLSKKFRYANPVLIIVCLWIFSILAGAQPAILRASVMFTFLVIGKTVSRNMSILNSLAASAFLLLCVNPFWLWNVGFQLSYAALLSLVIFNRPIYNLVYVKNKSLDQLWQLTAVSIAAQLLTTPFSVYYFHQFPVYFLITNIVAVPLSSLVLLGEILLCAVYFVPAVAAFVGKVVCFLIWAMNSFVEYLEALPFSMWQGLSINVIQATLLMIVIAGAGYWLIEKYKAGCQVALAASVLFLLLRSRSFLHADRQRKLIVYNVSKYRAMDIINGRQFLFIGDDRLRKDISLQNFHLKPSRILHRVASGDPGNIIMRDGFFQCGGKRIAVINSAIKMDTSAANTEIDLLIISGNPRLYITDMVKRIGIKQVVIDGTASPWKLRYWKEDCDALRIPCHPVSEKGAFIMNL